MRTHAAMVWEPGQDWKIEEIELDDPRRGEVLVRLAATGLCHSDEHVRTGDLPAGAYPMIGGHEGAGVVERIGPGVASVVPGDHVVMSFIPACGRCAWCSTGHQNLCEYGAGTMAGLQQDGTARHRAGSSDARLMCGIGAFSPFTVVHEASVIKINDDIPLATAALVSCGVATGWGSAAHASPIEPGDTVVVIGVGGVGINAVQGAVHAGAGQVVAVDPVAFKRAKAVQFGATHAVASVAEARPLVDEISWGRMAKTVIITVGVPTKDSISEGLSLVGKLGTVVLTAMPPWSIPEITMSMLDLVIYEKRVQGALFGSGNPRFDIPNLLALWQKGQLRLDGLVTNTYKLDEVNEAYQDMYDGRNLRGMLVFS